MSQVVTKTIRKLYDIEAEGQFQTSNGTINGHAKTTGHRYFWNDTVTYDVSNRNWKQLIRSKGSATTSLDGHYKICVPGWANAQQTDKVTGTTGFCWGCILTSNWSFPSASNGVANVAADNVARSKLLNHYINARTNWRGGNFLAELRETIHMIHHPLDTAYSKTLQWINAARKLRRLKGKSLGKALASDWLAYAFGIKPLIADIDDAKTAFDKIMDPDNADTLPIAGKGLISTASTVVKVVFANPVGSIPITFDEVTKISNTVKYYGRLKARPFGLGQTYEKFGVDPTDVAPAVWEAIPFSWFVDYFVNVSEILDAQRLWYADLAWMNRGIRNSIAKSQIGLRTTSSDATYRARTVSGKGVFAADISVSRRATSFPWPQFHFQMPGFPSLRWLNIAAVVRQKIRPG